MEEYMHRAEREKRIAQIRGLKEFGEFVKGDGEGFEFRKGKL